VLDELVVSRRLIDDRPAEQVRASVVPDLAAICRQSSEVVGVKERPALGSKAWLIELEPLGQLVSHPQAPVVRHGGEQAEQIREGARAA
jgi:hypothetical protein